MFRKALFAAIFGLVFGSLPAEATDANKKGLGLMAGALAKAQARKMEVVYSDVVIAVTSMSCTDRTVVAKVVGGSNSPGNVGTSLHVVAGVCSKLSANYDRVRAVRASKG